jgi:hypothetical protein
LGLTAVDAGVGPLAAEGPPSCTIAFITYKSMANIQKITNIQFYFSRNDILKRPVISDQA